MYEAKERNQIGIEGFFLPFGGQLQKDNRWIRLSGRMPWEQIEEIYLKSLDPEHGRRAYSARLAFGACFIKESENLTDERTVEAIQENPYMQYFLGLEAFHAEPLFDASMMVHFRRRFPVEEVAKINEYLCTGKWPEGARNVDRNDNNKEQETKEESEGTGSEASGATNGEGTVKQKDNKKKKAPKKQPKKKRKNRGKLIMDATVAPADIKYPTDLDLLNKCREHLEDAIDRLWPMVPHTSHKYPYSKKKARKSYLKLTKCKKWTRAKCRKAIADQLYYVDAALKRLEKWKAKIQGFEHHFPYWLKQRLEVIPKVYAQQKEMYDNNTCVCENRICSLEQPHVRPIKRGKRPNPTEFGQKLHLSVVGGYTYIEQTSWNNFNESLDLEATVNDYYRKFGYYPEAVLADRIYQTRANRNFCKKHNIRLSGPPLGRRKADTTEAKLQRQMYRDACERNVVESRNGIAKRRFGLDRIFSKLDENAKTEAALNILAMNAARWLAQWLALFYYFFLKNAVA